MELVSSKRRLGMSWGLRWVTSKTFASKGGSNWRVDSGGNLGIIPEEQLELQHMLYLSPPAALCVAARLDPPPQRFPAYLLDHIRQPSQGATPGRFGFLAAHDVRRNWRLESYGGGGGATQDLLDWGPGQIHPRLQQDMTPELTPPPVR